MLVLGAVLGLSIASSPALFAINVFDGSTGGTNACTSGATSSSSICAASKTDEVGPIINKVVNALLYVLGAVAVVMIIIGGVMYTTSGGDAGGVKKAKDTILYAVIGLVVAIFAYAIINFVVKAIK